MQIGTNATNQLQGNSRITNPSSAGVYTLTLYGSAGSSGDFLVSINAGQLVSAVIAENLAFTVSSVSDFGIATPAAHIDGNESNGSQENRGLTTLGGVRV